MGKPKVKKADSDVTTLKHKQKKKKSKKVEKPCGTIKSENLNSGGNSRKRKSEPKVKLKPSKKLKIDRETKNETANLSSDSENEFYIDKFFESPAESSLEIGEDDTTSLQSDVNSDSDALSDDCLVDKDYKVEKLRKISKTMMNEWTVEEAECNGPSTSNRKVKSKKKIQLSNGTSELQSKTIKFEEPSISGTGKTKTKKKDNLINKATSKLMNGIEEKPTELKSKKNPEKSKQSSKNIEEAPKKVAQVNGNVSEEIITKVQTPVQEIDEGDESWEDIDSDVENQNEIAAQANSSEETDEYETDSDYHMETEESGEFETDTDYSMGEEDMESYEESAYSEDYAYGFNAEDCESVSSKEHYHFSTDDSDSDYMCPEVEDKLIKKGEAVIYDAPSDIDYFSDASDAQLVEIPTTLDNPENENSNDSCPNLISVKQAEQQIENNVQKTIEYQDEVLPDTGEISKTADFYDCKDQNSVILKLSGTIHFNGVLTVTPILNCVEINGYDLGEFESIDAPSISRCDFYLNLTAITSECNQSQIGKAKEFMKNRLNDSEIDRVLESFDSNTDVLLFLEPALKSNAIQMLEKYSSHAILPFKSQILKKSSFPSSELILQTKFFANYDRQNGFYHENPDWINLQFSEYSKVMIVGGKNVGKSVLSQYLINKLVKRFGKVLLIDVDIGQPIIGLPQAVSAALIESKGLVGRGCLNNHIRYTSDKSILYGDKSVMISPFKYVRCVKELLKFCEHNKKYEEVPWIVNTMGYHKGFGLQLMCLLAKIIQPTDLVQIQHSIQSFNFSTVITEDVVNKFEMKMFEGPILDGVEKKSFFTTHTIGSVVYSQREDSKWISNATEKRKIMMLAHLSRILGARNVSLNDVRPYCASLDKISIVVMDENNAASKDTTLDILNGNIVYLCHKSVNQEKRDGDELLECFGVGLVRAIDRLNHNIYLLLPKPREEENFLQRINVLAICNFPVPSALLLKQNSSIENQQVPYISCIKNRYLSAKLINKKSIKDLF